MNRPSYWDEDFSEDDTQPVVAQIADEYWEISAEPLDYLVEYWVEEREGVENESK